MEQLTVKAKEYTRQVVQAKAAKKVQGPNPAMQLKDNRSSAVVRRQLQEMANNSTGVLKMKAMQQMADTSIAQRKINNTGLPDNLKTGVENLSGHSLDDVKVHYNSSSPAQLQAHAYAQGTDIHIAPGQEKHLPHEAWHVVQQKQGRVQPTLQMKGIAVNDDKGLEREADMMGEKALQMQVNSRRENLHDHSSQSLVVQKSATTALAILGAAGSFAYFGYKVREWYMNWKNLPAGAYARQDKSLTPVSVIEIDAMLNSAVHDRVLPQGLSMALLNTAHALISRGCLLWTGTGAPHAEVIISDQSQGHYNVSLVVVIPKSIAAKIPETDKMERGQAIHELIHGLEVVTKIGGPQNLGKKVPEVVQENNVLLGNQLQWSTIPENVSTHDLEHLMKLFNKDVNQKRGVQYGYYLGRLKYALSNRHEFPTIIVQIIHDIETMGDQRRLQRTDFYRKLLNVRTKIIKAMGIPK